ncbi:MAG TPA: dihydrolipoyl dehydrogenase [Longimicrobiaceae bacterium]|nr:dihydrolipoyl dehydrogenase [Longimicrobiaceae bacterium]
MEARVYDAVVIGGGPGGYTAAIRLAQLGKSVLCVERESLGGVCLNWGCIPSKALISAAGLVERIREAETMGIRVGAPEVDFARTQAWKDGIVARLTGSVATLIRGNGGEVAPGTARLVGPSTVEVRTADGAVERYEARDAVVVATGARLASIPGFEADGERIITAREAVSLGEVPRSLVVIGGGVIGMELGMMYQRLGTSVAVVEVTEGLLPGVDADLVRVVERRFRRRGGEVLTGARALGWEPRDGAAAVTVEHGGGTRVLEAERVLVSVGFQPNVRGLGLEEVGVRLDARGHVATDDRMRSSVPGIYAVGDVAGGPYLAHKAFREAEVAAEVIAGRNVRRDVYALPAAIFTDPEIAVVGMTEAEARREGRVVKVGRFPFAASGRAMSLGDTDGFVKVVADEERLLGVGIVGPEASELVAEAAFALEMVAAAEDVALTIHPHPTLSEGVMEAFKHALGEAVHVMNRRPARRADAPALVGMGA